MKKFIFTLVAALMSVATFAQFRDNTIPNYKTTTYVVDTCYNLRNQTFTTNTEITLIPNKEHNKITMRTNKGYTHTFIGAQVEKWDNDILIIVEDLVLLRIYTTRDDKDICDFNIEGLCV